MVDRAQNQPASLAAPPATPAVSTFDAEPGRFYLGCFRGISIAIWADQADGEFVKRSALMSRHWKKHYPNSRSSVGFVLKGVRPPTPEARTAFEAVHAGATGVKCIGIVLEGEGFWASRLRSTITGINIVGSSTALRIEPTIAALAPWLASEHATRVGEQLSEHAIVRALTSARYELAPPLLFPHEE